MLNRLGLAMDRVLNDRASLLDHFLTWFVLTPLMFGGLIGGELLLLHLIDPH